MLERFPPVVLVAIGGMIGAVSRYWISGYFKQSEFPYGTLIVNMLGSGLLGFLVTIYSFNIIDNNWLLLLGTGFMGSITTMIIFLYSFSIIKNSSSATLNQMSPSFPLSN